MSSITYTAKTGLDLQGTEVGAWLAETTAENVTATELVTNGDFPVNTTGWTFGNGATGAVVAGELRITADGTTFPYGRQTITCVIGKRYVLSATARRGTCVANARLYIFGISDSIIVTSSTSNVTIYSDFIATATSHFIDILIDGATTAGETAYFDNISCIIGTEDLSATDQALRYHGTLTKSAVATGAELMQFTGWSTSNYLSRAYGADLDITDEITLMAWINISAIHASDVQGICGNRNDGGGDQGGYGFVLNSVSQGSCLKFIVQGAAAGVEAVSTSVPSLNEWRFVVGTMTTAGLVSLYENGILADTGSSGVIDATATTFKIGVKTTSGAVVLPFSGGISAVHVINAVLTAAQILEIYENEKDLFKPYATYREVGTEYSLDVILETEAPSREVDNTVVRSLGGEQETIERSRDTWHNITIGSIARIPTAGETIAKQEITEFLESVQAGETFTLDIYGSVATPDDPVNVIADSGYSFGRVSNNLFTVPLRVREV